MATEKPVEIQGRKEVGEAVLIAVLCGVAAKLVDWGMDAVRNRNKDDAETSEPDRP